MFRHYRVILRQPVINTLPSYTSISIPVQCIVYCFVLWPTNAQLFHKLSHRYMFRHHRVILRQPVINTLPSYTSISIPVPCSVYCFVLWPTNAQLFHKLSHCYMFRHYLVILRQLVINTLPKLHQYFNTCTVHPLLFCTMTNKFTITSQIITLLHVSTLSCHPQAARKQFLYQVTQVF